MIAVDGQLSQMFTAPLGIASAGESPHRPRRHQPLLGRRLYPVAVTSRRDRELAARRGAIREPPWSWIAHLG